MARSLKEAVAAFTKGDASAFDDIYSATYRHVLVAAKMLMKNEQDAQDVAQDVYIRAYSSLGNLKSPDYAPAWFRAVTRNLCLNRLRVRTETLLGEDEEYIMENQVQQDQYAMPEQAYITKERDAILMGMVEELPLEQREAVLYYYIQDQPVSKVAELLQCSTGTVKSRLNYARAKLRAMASEKEREGIKLYGFGFIPFLGYFLRNAANHITLNPATAFNILATTHHVCSGTVAYSGSGATATGTGIGAAAAQSAAAASQTATAGAAGIGGLLSAAGTKLTAAVLATAICVTSIGIGVPVALASRDSYEHRPSGVRARQNRDDRESESVWRENNEDIVIVEENKLQDGEADIHAAAEGIKEDGGAITADAIDEWFDLLETLIIADEKRAENALISRTISKADTLALRGEYGWAVALVDNAMWFYPDNQALLNKLAELESIRTVPLRNMSIQIASGYIRRQESGVDQFSRFFDTRNFFTVSTAISGSRGIITLDGNYTRLTGKQILVSYGNGTSTTTFSIIGDGTTLFERSYKADRTNRLDGLDQDIAEIDIDLTGIGILEIRYARTTGGTAISDVGLVDFLFYQSGSAEGSTGADDSGSIGPQNSDTDSVTLIDGISDQDDAIRAVDIDELSTLLKALLIAEAESGSNELLIRAISKVDALAMQGKNAIATALVESMLSVYPDNPDLLSMRPKLSQNLEAPLLNLSWRRTTPSSSIIKRSGASDVFGNPFESANFYSVNTSSGSYTLIPLNANYSRLSGRLCLLTYSQGIETVMFRIVGDGITLYEYSYKTTSEQLGSREGMESSPISVDVDISGVDLIQIQAYTMNDGVFRGVLSAISQNFTIAHLGMVDFVVS